MRTLIFILALSLAAQAFAIPHLDLDMTSAEYQAYLKKPKLPTGMKSAQALDPASITYAIKLGERLSKWITLLNEGRSPQTAIRLTSASTRRSYPVETPNMYSPATVQRDTAKVLGDLPDVMKTVITGNDELPTTTSLDDDTFIKHARLIDRIYQTAARYKSVNPWRAQYVQMAANDVRGYYYLTKNNIGKDELQDVNTIAAEKLVLIKQALSRLCLNGGTNLKNCNAKVSKAVTENTLVKFYDQYFAGAKKNWDDFFDIPADARRKDVIWKDNTMTVPFNTPTIAKFVPYLQDNIQDEFRFGDWKLLINFGKFPSGPELIFQPGVVPHVNGLGGNQIVMDSNQPTEEYESQWTIRHEFGHVIGLPDCYHEFYDVDLDAYVNYQLDVTDLMCSRAGNMKERIFLELKQAYQ